MALLSSCTTLLVLFAIGALLAVFAPKGNEPEDLVEVIREASVTRPLNIKNTDNKTVAGVINNKWKPIIKHNIVSTQRGFVPDRQLVQNVVDLDTHNDVTGFSFRELL